MATAHVNPTIAATQPQPPEASAEQRRRRRKLRKSFQAYLFIAPAFIILFVFHFLPIFYAFFLSLYRRISVVSGLVPPPERFDWFGNYRTLFANAEFWNAFFNTIGYATGVVVIGMALALGIALLLDKVQEGKDFYRTAFFLPNVTSLVAVGAVWKVMFTSYSATALTKANPNHPGGLFNWIFSGFGLPMQRFLLDERGIFNIAFNGGKAATTKPEQVTMSNASFDPLITGIELMVAVGLVDLVWLHSRQPRNIGIARVLGIVALVMTLPLIGAGFYIFVQQILSIADSPIGALLTILLLALIAFYVYTKIPFIRKDPTLWATNYAIVVAIAAALTVLGNLAATINWAGWRSGPSLAMICVIIIAIWHSLGFNIVILLAGLTNISREYYEAARMDGAQGFAMFWRMTVPLLSPTLFFLLITSTIGALQSFTVIYAIFNTSGNSTTIPSSVRVLAIHYYLAAFGGGSDADVNGFGYASSVVMFMLVFILGLTLVQQRVIGKRVNYD